MTCIVIEKTLRHLLECVRLFDRKVSRVIQRMLCVMQVKIYIVIGRSAYRLNLKEQAVYLLNGPVKKVCIAYHLKDCLLGIHPRSTVILAHASQAKGKMVCAMSKWAWVVQRVTFVLSHIGTPVS
tara:strand:+ start:666 stop:1040 length:375 start_codon:yes stop_codon:yes gene_type:complete